MKYIVRIWARNKVLNETKYHEFMDLDEAVKFADHWADELRGRTFEGIEFDVSIYEHTDY